MTTHESRVRNVCSTFSVSIEKWRGLSFVLVVALHCLRAASAQDDGFEIPDVVAYTGKVFSMSFKSHQVYGNPDYSLQLSASSESNGDRLPSWLLYNDTARSLIGVPLAEDQGRIFLTIEGRCNKKRDYPSGYTSGCHDSSEVFQLIVSKSPWANILGLQHPSSSLPVESSSETISMEEVDSVDDSLTRGNGCEGARVLASLVLCASLDKLSPQYRLHLMSNLISFLSIPITSLILERSSSHVLKAVENKFQVIAAGPGHDGACNLSHSVETLWWLPCSTVKHLNDFIRVLQHNVDGGRLQQEISLGIVGWYVASSNSLLTRQNRRRRGTGQRTVLPTPVLSPLQPTTIVAAGITEDVVVSSALVSSHILHLSTDMQVISPENLLSPSQTSVLSPSQVVSSSSHSLPASFQEGPPALTALYPAASSSSSLSSTTTSSSQILLQPSSTDMTMLPEINSLSTQQLIPSSSSAHSTIQPSATEDKLIISNTTKMFKPSYSYKSTSLLPSSPAAMTTPPIETAFRLYSISSAHISYPWSNSVPIELLSQSSKHVLLSQTEPKASADYIQTVAPSLTMSSSEHSTALTMESKLSLLQVTLTSREVTFYSVGFVTSRNVQVVFSQTDITSVFTSPNAEEVSSQNVHVVTSQNIDILGSQTVDLVNLQNVDLVSQQNVDVVTSQNVLEEAPQNVNVDISYDVELVTSQHVDAEASTFSSSDSSTPRDIEMESSLFPSAQSSFDAVSMTILLLSTSNPVVTTADIFQYLDAYETTYEPSTLLAPVSVSSNVYAKYLDTEYPYIEYPNTEYPPTEYPETKYIRTEYPNIEYQSTVYPQIEYSLTEYPQTKYQHTEYPPTEYPQTKYQHTEYPPTESPHTEYSQSEYPLSENPQTKYLQSEYPYIEYPYTEKALPHKPGNVSQHETLYLKSSQQLFSSYEQSESTESLQVYTTTKVYGLPETIVSESNYASSVVPSSTNILAARHEVVKSNILGKSDDEFTIPIVMIESATSLSASGVIFSFTPSSAGEIASRVTAAARVTKSSISGPHDDWTRSPVVVASKSSTPNHQTSAPVSLTTSAITRRHRARTTTSIATATTVTTTPATRRTASRKPTTLKVRTTTPRVTARWDTEDIDYEPDSDKEPLNNRPYVQKPIKVIRADQGKLLEFIIPHDAFYDIEDGDTRHLTLSLELPSNQDIPSSFWLFLDSAQQVIKGLPLHEDMDIKNVSVVLVARDVGGLEATDYITLQINDTPRRHFTHLFRMKFALDFRQFMRNRRNVTDLLERIGTYFGDPDPKFMTVLEVRQGSFVLTWTNNTLTDPTCQTEIFKTLFSQMVRRDGIVRSSFSRHIGRHLQLKEVQLQPLGICNIPPTSTTETVATHVVSNIIRGHGFSVWAHVILPVLVALLVFIFIILIIILCNRRRRRRQATLNIDKDAMSNDCNQILYPGEVEADESSLKAPTSSADPHPNQNLTPASSLVKNNLNLEQERARKNRDNREHEWLNKDSQPLDVERDQELNRNWNRNHPKDSSSGKRQKDRDRMSGVSASSSLSCDRPNNHYLEEEAGSRSSTLRSTKSTGSDKRHRKNPPHYWQPQTDPPPYRMPPPYLANNTSQL